MLAKKERAQNWEEHKQQSNWAQSRPTHSSETSPNRTQINTQGNHEVRALQQPPNAAHAERAINKHPPPSLYKVPTYSTRAGAAPCAPGGARHGGGNRAVTSQPRTGQFTSYGDVKSSCRGGGGQAGGTGGGAQQRHPGAPTDRGRSNTDTQNAGATPRGTRASTSDKEEAHNEAREANRTAGTGNQNGGDGRVCAWEVATIKGMAWPAAPSLPGARATPAQPASGGGCLLQPRWAVCAIGAGAHQGQTSREGEKDIWWTVGTMRGGTGHLGLTHTKTQRGRLWTACGQRRVDSKNSQTTPATTSTTSIRQLLGAADAQTAQHATFSTAQLQHTN